MSAPPTLNYGQLMQRAMRGLMAEVLGVVAENGLFGDHHFYIGFDTTHPGVDISDRLRAQHPEEMTIVLQHEFGDLAVIGDRFQVTLSFQNRPETLVVPLDAVTTFVDPSVEFGLRFDGQDTDADQIEDLSTDAADSDDEEDPDKPDGDKPQSADVVNLDKFRK